MPKNSARPIQWPHPDEYAYLSGVQDRYIFKMSANFADNHAWYFSSRSLTAPSLLMLMAERIRRRTGEHPTPFGPSSSREVLPMPEGYEFDSPAARAWRKRRAA